MKSRVYALILAAVMIVASVGSVSGQDFQRSMNTTISKIRHMLVKQSMSARVIMTMSGARLGSVGPMEFLITMSKGNVRTEMDYAKLMASVGAGKGKAPMGIDKMVTIYRPDKKVMYQVVPSLNACLEMAIQDPASGKADEIEIDRTSEGFETIGKYVCEKVRNKSTTSANVTTEVVMWEAKELGGMPIRMETTTPEGVVTMNFEDINTATPPASMFEPPVGATKYNTTQEMMMGAMMKMMQGK